MKVYKLPSGRTLLFAVLLGTVTVAEGATVPLRSLLSGGTRTTGSLRVDNNLFLISKRTGEGRDLLLGITQLATERPGRVSAVSVLALREYPTPAERSLFNEAVINVALKCFNLRPERKTAIVAWLNRQNVSTFRNVAANFGPMNLRFVRDLDEEGTYWTAVQMRRQGLPGTAPWVNYCTP